MAFIIDWVGILSVKLQQLQKEECKVFLNYLIEITGEIFCFVEGEAACGVVCQTWFADSEEHRSFIAAKQMFILFLYRLFDEKFIALLLGWSSSAVESISQTSSWQEARKALFWWNPWKLWFEGASNNALARLFWLGNWLLWFDLLINTLKFGVWEAELIFNCCEHLCLVEN